MKKNVPVTIVGGRPPEDKKSYLNIPVGIEILLKKASVDENFQEILLAKKGTAADEISLELSKTEKDILNVIPANQLKLMIKQVKVADAEKPVFLGKVAAAMLAAISTAALSAYSCDQDKMEHKVTGARPDIPSPSPSETVSPSATSTPTSTPTIVIPASTIPPAPTGIRPDIPSSSPAKPVSPSASPGSTDFDIQSTPTPTPSVTGLIPIPAPTIPTVNRGISSIPPVTRGISPKL